MKRHARPVPVEVLDDVRVSVDLACGELVSLRELGPTPVDRVAIRELRKRIAQRQAAQRAPRRAR